MAQFKEIDDYEYPFEVGVLPERSLAFKFADYLNSIGIKATAKPGFGVNYCVYVANEKDVSKAKLELLRFGNNPFAKAYNQASWAQARKIKRERTVKNKMWGFSLGGGRTWQLNSLTSIIEIICLVVFVLALLPGPMSFFVSTFSWTSLSSITEDFELWRLITPIFLHFGFLHIAFNLVMFEAFARPLERHLGWLHLLYVVLSIALVSNVLQLIFLSYNSVFGGLSGVVYGVIGYMAVLSRRPDLPDDMRIPPGLLLVSAIFIGLGFFLSGIANVCHLAGLLMGLALGFINYRLPLRQR